MANMTVGQSPELVLADIKALIEKLEFLEGFVGEKIGTIKEKEGVPGLNTLPSVILEKYEPLKANLTNLKSSLETQYKHAVMVVDAAGEVSAELEGIS